MKWGGHCSRGGRGEGGGRPRQRSAIFPASETRRVASEGSVPRGRMHGRPVQETPQAGLAEPSKWCCAPCRAVPCLALPGVFTPPFRHALCCGKLTSSAHYRGGSSQELIDPDALLLRAPMGSRPRSAHLCTKHVLGTGAEWRFEAALPAVDNVFCRRNFQLCCSNKDVTASAAKGLQPQPAP